jgi:chromate reductase, NAD(P)H dehydrogenase (quinone)
VRWLTLSGSLRRASTNSAALAAFAMLAPAGVEVVAWNGLASLPPFNPDDDAEGASTPAAVAELRAAVSAADALAIAAPEYAHGLPGAFKNALDWLVASDALVGKPIVLINAAPRAFHAQSALREILGTMAARLLPEAFAALPLTGKDVTADEIVADPRLAAPLRDAALALYQSLGGAQPKSNAS